MGHSPAQQFAITEEISDLFFEMREHFLEGGRRLVRVVCLIFSRYVAHHDYWRLCLTSATSPAFHSAFFVGCGFGAIADGGNGRPARLQFVCAGGWRRRGGSVQTASVLGL